MNSVYLDPVISLDDSRRSSQVREEQHSGYGGNGGNQGGHAGGHHRGWGREARGLGETGGTAATGGWVELVDIGRAIEAAGAVRRFSRKTTHQYVWWARKFVVFYACGHPLEVAGGDPGVAVTGFLTHLAMREGVAAATQNQALQALLFLYGSVLGRPVPEGTVRAVRAKRPLRLPVVLSREQMTAFFQHIDGPERLVALLQYGSGLRLMEALRLRTKDVDLDRKLVLVRHGKGGKDRIVPLPGRLEEPLREHLRRRWRMHQEDLATGRALVALPEGLVRRGEGQATTWAWQWVFASYASGHPSFSAPNLAIMAGCPASSN